jgi:hypothetical protein
MVAYSKFSYNTSPFQVIFDVKDDTKYVLVNLV